MSFTSGPGGTLEESPALVALHDVDAAIGRLAETNLWAIPASELLELRVDAEATRARLDAVVLSMTREIDGRGAATEAGAASTAAWLRGRVRLHPGAAKAEVALARQLDADLTATGAALAAGDISLDHVGAIAGAMKNLPRDVDAATRSKAEDYLTEQALSFDSSALQRLGSHLILVLDPERGATLERDEAEQADRQELTVSRGADGGRPVRGRFGPVDGAFLDTVLASVSAPRPAEDGTPDPRSPAQRRAEGLVELLKLAMGHEDSPESGGEPVTLVVTTTLDQMRATSNGCNHASAYGEDSEPVDPSRVDVPQPEDSASSTWPPAKPCGAATLEDGTALAPETVRRLGCDSWLVAALTGAGRQVLDIGRSSRVVPRAIRRALVLRDGGCAFPGCGRPPRWCHAHHIRHWADGGPTALDNLVLLCGHHHRVVHHDGWQVDIGDRSDGRSHGRSDDTTAAGLAGVRGLHGPPRFTPPPWIDPAQVPRAAWRPPEDIDLG